MCRTCCEQLIQKDCPHDNPNDRILRGTWVSEEIKMSVKVGYVIQNVYESLQYQMTQYNQKDHKGGMFAQYIEEFFAQKTMVSGYRPECVTDQDKIRYVRELEETVGIKLDEDSISYNASLRSVAKLCLNSLRGKLAQRENITKTKVVTRPERLMELLTSSEVDVNGILTINDETLYVNWIYKTEALTSSPSTSVIVAA